MIQFVFFFIALFGMTSLFGMSPNFKEALVAQARKTFKKKHHSIFNKSDIYWVTLNTIVDAINPLSSTPFEETDASSFKKAVRNIVDLSTKVSKAYYEQYQWLLSKYSQEEDKALNTSNTTKVLRYLMRKKFGLSKEFVCTLNADETRQIITKKCEINQWKKEHEGNSEEFIKKITAGKSRDLRIAARDGHDKLVQLLIDELTNAYDKDKVGLVNALFDHEERHFYYNNEDNALENACENGHLKVIKVFFEACKQLFREDTKELIALYTTALRYASMGNHLDSLQFIVNELKIICDDEMNIFRNALTYLHNASLTYACRNGNTEIAQLLITELERAFGVNQHGFIHSLKDDGDSALRLALRGGHLDIIYLLYDRAYAQEINYDFAFVLESERDSLINLARRQEKSSIIPFLIEKLYQDCGDNKQRFIDIVSIYNNLILQEAIQRNQEEVVECLLTKLQDAYNYINNQSGFVNRTSYCLYYALKSESLKIITMFIEKVYNHSDYGREEFINQMTENDCTLLRTNCTNKEQDNEKTKLIFDLLESVYGPERRSEFIGCIAKTRVATNSANEGNLSLVEYFIDKIKVNGQFNKEEIENVLLPHKYSLKYVASRHTNIFNFIIAHLKDAYTQNNVQNKTRLLEALEYALVCYAEKAVYEVLPCSTEVACEKISLILNVFEQVCSDPQQLAPYLTSALSAAADRKANAETMLLINALEKAFDSDKKGFVEALNKSKASSKACDRLNFSLATQIELKIFKSILSQFNPFK